MKASTSDVTVTKRSSSTWRGPRATAMPERTKTQEVGTHAQNMCLDGA
jgi:hypothetical protein